MSEFSFDSSEALPVNSVLRWHLVFGADSPNNMADEKIHSLHDEVPLGPVFTNLTYSKACQHGVRGWDARRQECKCGEGIALPAHLNTSRVKHAA